MVISKIKVGDDLETRQHSIIKGAIENDLNEVMAALAEDSNSIMDRDDRLGVTALHIAAGEGNFSMVRFLCSQAGCDPFALDYMGRRPGLMALAIGRQDIYQEIKNLYLKNLRLGEDDPDVLPFPPKPRGPSP